jgi:hypothetical protein
MMPQNQLDSLADAPRLRARGIVYAYRLPSGLLVTFHRAPEAVQCEMVADARRALEMAPERVAVPA